MAKTCSTEGCSDEDCGSCGSAGHSHSKRGVGMDSLPEDLKKDLMLAQQMQQQMQMVAMQKAQFSMQSAETDRALEECAKAKGMCYRFVGSVLVPKDAKELEKELKEEKEMLEVRVKALEKQEKMAKDKLDELGKKLERFQRGMGGDSASVGAQ